jgi:hypothetical protein
MYPMYRQDLLLQMFLKIHLNLMFQKIQRIRMTHLSLMYQTTHLIPKFQKNPNFLTNR